MINLLPEETKKHLRAARTNFILIRYSLFIGFAVIFLIIAFLASYLNLDGIKKASSNGNPIKTSSSSPVANKANELNTNLAKAKTVLNQQISYSSIINSLLSTIPSGIILESPITIDNSNINTPISLKAYLKTASDESKLKNSFQNSTVFSDYTAQPSTNGTSGPAAYPILINFTIMINKEQTR